jgi:hypothetical protein
MTCRVPLDLVFRSLGECDGCGAPLPPGDRMAGICYRSMGRVEIVDPGASWRAGSPLVNWKGELVPIMRVLDRG